MWLTKMRTIEKQKVVSNKKVAPKVVCIEHLFFVCSIAGINVSVGNDSQGGLLEAAGRLLEAARKLLAAAGWGSWETARFLLCGAYWQ